jgi:hypothetical protein
MLLLRCRWRKSQRRSGRLRNGIIRVLLLLLLLLLVLLL